MILGLDEQLWEMEKDAKSQPKVVEVSPNRISSVKKGNPLPILSPKKTYNYKPRIVDRRKMTQDELYDLNHTEIFSFYSHQHVKNNKMFDEMQTIMNNLDMGEYNKFCKDFNIALPKLKLVDTYKKVAAETLKLDYKKF